MQNFNEFLEENYDMTEEEYLDMETSPYDTAKRVVWAEWEEYVKHYIG